MMYIYLTSKDFSGFHYNNKGSDFVATLPSSLFFSRHEEWEIGLLDFYIIIPKNVISSKERMIQPIHVCCNVVEPSAFNEKQVNVLTSVRLKDCTKAVYEPSVVRYVPLAQECLTNLHIYLKDSTGAAVSFEDAVTYCTLHISRKSS